SPALPTELTALMNQSPSKQKSDIARPPRWVMPPVCRGLRAALSPDTGQADDCTELGWTMGFEPTTTGITIRYSNQLSYAHHKASIAPSFHGAFSVRHPWLTGPNRARCLGIAQPRFVPPTELRPP